MFNSPEQALAFAFRMRHTEVVSLPTSSYIANKTEHQHSSARLTTYDLKAQAGMVFSWLSRRPEMEQIYAFYLHGTMKERRLAASLFVRQNRSLLSKYKLSARELVNVMVGKSVRDSSAESGLSNWKAWKLRRDLAEIFEPIQQNLMTAMHEELILPGALPSNSVRH